MGIHWQELVIILLIVLVLFGPKRLPEIGRSLGNGIREFRESMSGRRKDDELVEPLAVEVEVERADAATADAAR
jgi:sec-independent protein translocase protein TatA